MFKEIMVGIGVTIVLVSSKFVYELFGCAIIILTMLFFGRRKKEFRRI